DQGAGARGPAAARGPLLRLHVRATPVRIVYDVSPLSHPRTGVGNYVLGALRGIVAARGPDEVVAFAPATSGGRDRIEQALAGLDVERALPALPLAHPIRTAWSRLQRPPLERFLGPLDV